MITSKITKNVLLFGAMLAFCALASVKIFAAVSYEDMKFNDKVEAAVLEMTSDDETQREKALRKIVDELGRRSVPKLIEQYKIYKGKDKFMLLRALCELRDERALEIYREAACAEEVPVKSLALQTLALLADKESVDLFLVAAESETEELREVAALALARLPDNRAIPALARIVAQNGKSAKLRAILALGEIGGTEVLPTLRTSLQNADADVREYAANALYKCPSIDAQKALQKAFAAEQDQFVKSALKAAIEAFNSLQKKQNKG